VICPTSPARPYRVSGCAPETDVPETRGWEDPDDALVEDDGGTVVEARGPNIFDTRLIRSIVLPDVERRLYECEIGGQGLRVRGRRRGGAVAAARVELGRGIGFLSTPFGKPETKIVFA